MNTKDLIRLGVPVGEPIRLAHEFIQSFIAQGNDGAQPFRQAQGRELAEWLEGEIFNIVANPPAFFADELRAPLARAIYRPAFTPRAELPLRRLCSHRSAVGREALPRSAFAPWRHSGEGFEAETVKQMANACALPSRPSTSPRFSPPPPRWSQLGTSGSGNHFVEFGAFKVEQASSLLAAHDHKLEACATLPPGEYLALLTHSGSRGTGAQV